MNRQVSSGRECVSYLSTHLSSSLSLSIPVLNNPFQPRCGHPARRLLIPLHTRNRPFPSPNLMMHLTSLIIPKADPTSTISARNPVATGAYIYVYCIPTCVMATEFLLTILAEAVGGSVNDNLVIAALKADGFPGWMRSCSSEGEHVRFSDELDRDGNVQLPGPQGLVV